jgi:hypothetical protein
MFELPKGRLSELGGACEFAAADEWPSKLLLINGPGGFNLTIVDRTRLQEPAFRLKALQQNSS